MREKLEAPLGAERVSSPPPIQAGIGKEGFHSFVEAQMGIESWSASGIGLFLFSFLLALNYR